MPKNSKSDHALQTGLAHHRAGRLAEASACYAGILKREPRHADALNLSGVLARQHDDLDRSASLIARAIERNPRAATYHHNLARTYALQQKPEQAIASYRRAIALNPHDLDSIRMLADLFTEAGQSADAIDHLKQAIDRTPDHLEIYLQLASLLSSLGQYAEALDLSQQALTRFPDAPASHLNHANTLFLAGRAAESLPHFRQALSLGPENPEAHNCLGRVLHELGMFEPAREAYSAATRLRPDFAEALSNLGGLHLDLGDLRTGEFFLRRAIEIKPDFLNAHSSLGALLERQGNSLAATECFRKVLMADPAHVPTLCNLGLTLEHLGDEAGAITCYQMALEKEPDTPLARFNLSLHFLAQGSFSSGWRDYEERWRTREFSGKRSSIAQPQWRGEDIRGARIYLYAEQGFGDTIHFARYAALVADLGAQVYLEVQPEMQRLLAGLHPTVRILARGVDPIPTFDWHSPLMSLPGVFGTNADNTPAAVPYLYPDPTAAAEWSARLASPALRVGLVWSGNPAHTRDRLRSIPLSRFARMLGMPRTAFYSLQKGPASSELNQLPSEQRPTDLAPYLLDFADTAAAIDRLDHVITVDTAVAHLAGAMGKPVWILLPQVSDWRWLKDRTDSPWYPTATLFRQTAPGGWDQVLAQVGAALEHKLALTAGDSSFAAASPLLNAPGAAMHAPPG